MDDTGSMPLDAPAKPAEVAKAARSDAIDVPLPPFPRTIAGLQDAVLEQKTRRIDLDEAARILNEVRADPKQPLRHRELAGRITKEQVAAWDAALGLSRGQRRAMRNMAFAGGLLAPTSNTVFNTLNYLAVPMLPFIFERMKSPAAQAGLSFGLAAAVQPLVTAPLQTYIVAGIDVMRQKNAPSVKLDKASINAKQSPRQVDKAIDAAAQTLEDGQAALASRLEDLALAHGVQPPKDAKPGSVAHVQALMEKLSPAERDDVGELAQANADTMRRIGDLVGSMQVAEGVQSRQRRSTTVQIAPRTMRAGSGIAAPFVKPRGADARISWVDKHSPLRKFSLHGAAWLSAGVAMGCQALQHLTAGFDEVTAQDDEHRLNMLYADVTKGTPSRHGELKPQELDEGKLRALVALPETQMVNRVAALLKKEMAALREKYPEPDLEPGVPLSGAARQAEDRIRGYREEIGILESGQLTTLPRDGRAHGLLEEVTQRFAAGYALREGHAKLNGLEFSAQYGQRLGQALTFGVAGSVGAVSAGRVVSAFLGGHDKTALSTEFGLALGGMALGAFSAATQWTAVNVKNERREGDMSLGRQVWNGVISPYLALKDELGGRHGTQVAKDSLAHEQQATAVAAALESLVNDDDDDDTPHLPGGWKKDALPATSQASTSATAPAPLGQAQADVVRAPSA